MGLILPSGLLASLLLEGGAPEAPEGSPQPGPLWGLQSEAGGSTRVPQGPRPPS